MLSHPGDISSFNFLGRAHPEVCNKLAVHREDDVPCLKHGESRGAGQAPPDFEHLQASISKLGRNRGMQGSRE